MFHVISNPISGRKKKNNVNQQIIDYLKQNNVEFCYYESKYYKHPTELAKQITSKNDSGNIIVIGGDGTFNEVINGVVDLSKWNIGLVPTGSGNDFASCLKLPVKKPIECLKLILKKELKPVDYIKINDMVCANVLGTGVDVAVLKQFEKHKKLKGSFRYLVSFVEAVSSNPKYEFDVSLDGGEFERKEGFIVVLCNGSSIGGGITICPNANPSDHQMEFVFVKSVKKSKVLPTLIKVLQKKIFDMDVTQHVYCKKAVFKDSKNLMLQIDGNITNDYCEYSCEIVSDGLNMYR